MIVWIVESGYNYESSSIEGVFDSEEKAVDYINFAKARKSDPNSYSEFDWIDYQKVEVQ